MPTKRFALTEGGPKNLEVSWKGSWKNLTVKLADQTVLTVASAKELKDGRSVTLATGQELSVILKPVLIVPELQLTLDGEPVPGSAGDPKARLKTAYGIIFFVAGFSGLIGLVAELGKVQFLLQIGFGWSGIITGAIFGILGYFVMRRSLVALIIAIVLFAVDGIFTFSAAASQTGTPPIGAVLVRVFLLIGMIQGVPAIKQLKQRELL